MKHIFFIITFYPALLACQNIVSDTSYLTQSGDNYLFVERFNYDNGGYLERSTFIGDGPALVARARTRMEATARQYADVVGVANKYTREIAGAIREDQSITALTGTSPIGQLIEGALPFLLDSTATWQINAADGTVSNFRFFTTAQGALRYQVGTATARQCIAFGTDVIRLTAYPAQGSNIDLYWNAATNRYVNLGGSVTVRRIRNVTR